MAAHGRRPAGGQGLAAASATRPTGLAMVAGRRATRDPGRLEVARGGPRPLAERSAVAEAAERHRSKPDAVEPRA